MENLLKGFNHYKSNTYPEIKDHMLSLADGQKPHTFLITCADSRISTDQFSNAKAGEVFVIRNAGNVIEKYSQSNQDSLSLTLEYGVVALGIPEIVVCGHASCGAMGGIMKLDQLGSMPLVQQGLKKVKDGFEFDFSQVKELEDLIELNVKQQLKNLMSYPFVKKRVEAGTLNLWGWVYDFSKAELSSKFNYNEIKEDV